MAYTAHEDERGTPMMVDANGSRFHCRVDGPGRVDGPAGAPWIAFSNSLATDLSMWDDQVGALRHRYRVLRYDQRGHGLSAAPEGDYDFALLVADALALLDAHGIERCHFVGLSMGGVTALGLAEQHGARLLSVAVCDANGASSPEGARAWSERCALARAQGIEALVEPTVKRWFHPDYYARNPAGLEKVRGMIRTTPLAGFLGCAAALSNYDYKTDLGRIRVPTLFLAGAEDGAVPQGMRAMAASVPNARYAEVSPAGHISNIEQPEAFTKALGDFIASVAS